MLDALRSSGAWLRAGTEGALAGLDYAAARARLAPPPAGTQWDGEALRILMRSAEAAVVKEEAEAAFRRAINRTASEGSR